MCIRADGPHAGSDSITREFATLNYEVVCTDLPSAGIYTIVTLGPVLHLKLGTDQKPAVRV